MAHVSPSSISKFLDCQYDWYVAKALGVSPVGADSRFGFGKLAHALMEPALKIHWASGGSAAAVLGAMSGRSGEIIAREAFAVVREEDGVDADEELAQSALEVVRWNLARMNLDAWETLTIDDGSPTGRPAVELELREAGFAYELDLLGRVDWIARRRETGAVWIIDHKTTKNIIDTTTPVEFHMQLALYRRLAREVLGIDTPFSAINLMRNKAPAVPAPLKSKTRPALSRANISTDWPTYLAAVREHGFDPADYEDQREKLQPSRFRAMLTDCTTGYASGRLERLATETALQMQDVRRGSTVALRNRKPTRSCSGCQSKAWCDATLSGEDPRSLIGLVYNAGDVHPTTASPYALSTYRQRTAATGPFAETVLDDYVDIT